MKDEFLNRRNHRINGPFKCVGDIHGAPGVVLAEIENEIYPKEKVLNYIFLGDVGVGFSEFNFGPLSKMSKRFAAIDSAITCYILRGNHDNPRYFRGAKLREIERRYPNIKVLSDFDTLEFDDGISGIVIPGAISVDRIFRREFKDWWSGEPPLYSELDNIEDGHYDFIFAHGGVEPSVFQETHKPGILSMAAKYDITLMDDIRAEHGFWERAIKKFTPVYVFIGHFHISHIQTKGLATLRYHDINEIV